MQTEVFDGVRMSACGLAAPAVAAAADRINNGPLPKRSPEPPDDSLIHRDACGMLGNKSLSVVPGIDASDPDSHFGAWTCVWQSTTTDIEVNLRFNRPELQGDDDSSTVTLDGHKAVVMPELDGSDTCAVDVAGPSYTDQDGDDSLETVRLSVSGADTADEACQLATELARSASARLPAS